MVSFWFVCSDCFNYTLGGAEVVYGHSFDVNLAVNDE